MDKVWYTYALECADKTLYVGITNDIAKRVQAHNHEKNGAKYTKARRPVRLIYQESFQTRSEALKKEAAFKKLTRQEKLSLFYKVDK
jgi:putative endonuclease